MVTPIQIRQLHTSRPMIAQHSGTGGGGSRRCQADASFYLDTYLPTYPSFQASDSIRFERGKGTELPWPPPALPSRLLTSTAGPLIRARTPYACDWLLEAVSFLGSCGVSRCQNLFPPPPHPQRCGHSGIPESGGQSNFQPARCYFLFFDSSLSRARDLSLFTVSWLPTVYRHIIATEPGLPWLFTRPSAIYYTCMRGIHNKRVEYRKTRELVKHCTVRDTGAHHALYKVTGPSKSTPSIPRSLSRSIHARDK